MVFTKMAFKKTLVLYLFALTFSSALATPVPDENKALEKRGALLTGQWDTESQVRGLI